MSKTKHRESQITKWIEKPKSASNVRWSKLYELGHSKILKTSYFWFVAVPIIAKISNNIEGNLLSIPWLGIQWTVAFDLPFSWKMFYLSSLFFVVALLTYYIYCPEIVRLYRDFKEFEDRGQGGYTLNRYMKGITNNSKFYFTQFDEADCQIMCTYYFLNDRDMLVKFRSLDEKERTYSLLLYMLADTSTGIQAGKEQSMFWHLHGIYDKTDRIAIIYCSILYLLGILCIGFVLVENALSVIKLIVREGF